MKKIALLMATVAISIFSLGCTDQSNTTSTAAGGNGGAAQQDDGHDHSHDHEPGPHGGQIIDLGHDHEYHAELVHDDEAGSVSIYMLDQEMKPHGIDESSVSLTLTVGDDTKQFDLASTGEENKQFTSEDKDLMTLLDAEGAEGKLRVTIGDTPYTGAISHHDHDH